MKIIEKTASIYQIMGGLICLIFLTTNIANAESTGSWPIYSFYNKEEVENKIKNIEKYHDQIQNVMFQPIDDIVKKHKIKISTIDENKHGKLVYPIMEMGYENQSEQKYEKYIKSKLHQLDQKYLEIYLNKDVYRALFYDFDQYIYNEYTNINSILLTNGLYGNLKKENKKLSFAYIYMIQEIKHILDDQKETFYDSVELGFNDFSQIEKENSVSFQKFNIKYPILNNACIPLINMTVKSLYCYYKSPLNDQYYTWIANPKNDNHMSVLLDGYYTIYWNNMFGFKDIVSHEDLFKPYKRILHFKKIVFLK